MRIIDFFSRKKGKRIASKKDYEIIAIKAMRFLASEKNLLNSSLDQKMLSEELKIPKSYISLAINFEYGQSFREIINRMRISQIKRALIAKECSHLTIEAIASDFGYSSSATFYRVFKKYVGVSPTEYRKEQLKKSTWSNNNANGYYQSIC